MDFGYAFDSLIWDASHHGIEVDQKTYEERVAEIISEAIRVKIVPLKYLTDSEILVSN